MAVSRDIRTIWVTNYDKSIGDVLEFIASSTGYVPFADDPFLFGIYNQNNRSTVTGVHEITKAGEFWVGGSKFWGEDGWDFEPVLDLLPMIDYNLAAGVTTITLDEDASNTVFDGVSAAYPGYLVVEDEIMTYTGIDESSPWRAITGITRGQLNTTDVDHDGSVDPIFCTPYFPGSVQSIEYDEEDEVYAVGVAMPYMGEWLQPLPNIGTKQWEFTQYRVFRFEFSKHVVDLVVYDDTEYATTIRGWIPGFAPWVS